MRRRPVNYSVLIKNARINNCFIYQKSKKRWWTPEELEEVEIKKAQDIYNSMTTEWEDDFALYDPWVAIKYYHKWMVAITERITDLEKKIDENFVVESKARAKKGRRNR